MNKLLPPSLGLSVLLTLTTGLLPAQAASMSMPMSAMSGGPAGSALAYQAQFRSVMLPVANHLMTLSGRDLDRDFLSMMIPYHLAAIDSSRAYLARGNNAQVRAYAQTILSGQERELAQIRSMLRGYGAPTDMDMQMQRKMADMDMAGRVRASRAPEHTFLEDMIPHHAGANETSNIAIQRSQTPAVLRLAQAILASQSEQITEYQGWLRTHR